MGEQVQMLDLDGLIFDKDGTLFEFSASWEAWAMALVLDLAEGDKSRASVMGDAIGFHMESNSFRRDAIVITHTVGEIADTLTPLQTKLSSEEIARRMNAGAASAPMAPAVPLAPLLDTLRDGGICLGVATNDAEAPAQSHLEQAGIRDRFDFIAGCDSGFGGKPAPGQLLAFSEATGIAPERIAMVGDSTHDLEAGRRAGMRTIGVLTGLASADDLAHLADVVLPDIGHIPPMVLTGR